MRLDTLQIALLRGGDFCIISAVVLTVAVGDGD